MKEIRNNICKAILQWTQLGESDRAGKIKSTSFLIEEIFVYEPCGILTLLFPACYSFLYKLVLCISTIIYDLKKRGEINKLSIG